MWGRTCGVEHVDQNIEVDGKVVGRAENYSGSSFIRFCI